jgi:hypothetical protein
MINTNVFFDFTDFQVDPLVCGPTAKEKRVGPTKGRKETSLCEETDQTQPAPAFSMLQTMVLRPGTATHERREPQKRTAAAGAAEGGGGGSTGGGTKTRRGEEGAGGSAKERTGVEEEKQEIEPSLEKDPGPQGLLARVRVVSLLLLLLLLSLQFPTADDTISNGRITSLTHSFLMLFVAILFTNTRWL